MARRTKFGGASANGPRLVPVAWSVQMSRPREEETMKTLGVGLVLVLVMTFATPLLSFADDQYPLHSSITTNKDRFGLHDSKLTVSVSIQNPGLPAVVDF